MLIAELKGILKLEIWTNNPVFLYFDIINTTVPDTLHYIMLEEVFSSKTKKQKKTRNDCSWLLMKPGLVAHQEKLLLQP